MSPEYPGATQNCGRLYTEGFRTLKEEFVTGNSFIQFILPKPNKKSRLETLLFINVLETNGRNVMSKQIKRNVGKQREQIK